VRRCDAPEISTAPPAPATSSVADASSRRGTNSRNTITPDLERALASLGAREREIIALRFGGELSEPKIAELTGLSLANVQQILSRSHGACAP
jgi:RNA polymerase sigma factor (sigma-70 family)